MNVLVADDHPLVRDALAQVVARLRPGVTVHLAPDFPSALRLIEHQALDAAVIDLQMPGLDALEGLRRAHALRPALPLLVVSGEPDPRVARAALDAGAWGFVSKSAEAEALLQMLRRALSGEPPAASPAPVLAPPAAAAPAASELAARLTARQRDVLRLLGEGQPNRAIAERLGLAEGTVKLHIAAILRTLRVRNRTEAALRARAAGLLD